MSDPRLTLGSGEARAQVPKTVGFLRFAAVCAQCAWHLACTVHCDMVRTFRRLPFWSRLLVLPLAAGSIAATPAERGRLVPLERVEQVSVLVDDMTPDAETASLT